MRSTAAQIRLQLRPDLGIAGVGISEEQGVRAHHHAWDAVAALRGLFLDKRALQRTWAIGGPEPFEGRDLFSLQLSYWSDAGEGRHSSNHHGACPALADPAAEFGSIEMQILAQDV